ncbi:hypothetical protein ON010_g7839 [Phytophthora cinnamomi]|nr:hypothetical protein ON010_g7839 [Phytophthora cinnamomi]
MGPLPMSDHLTCSDLSGLLGVGEMMDASSAQSQPEHELVELPSRGPDRHERMDPTGRRGYVRQRRLSLEALAHGAVLVQHDAGLAFDGLPPFVREPVAVQAEALKVLDRRVHDHRRHELHVVHVLPGQIQLGERPRRQAELHAGAASSDRPALCRRVHAQHVHHRQPDKGEHQGSHHPHAHALAHASLATQCLGGSSLVWQQRQQHQRHHLHAVADPDRDGNISTRLVRVRQDVVLPHVEARVDEFGNGAAERGRYVVGSPRIEAVLQQQAQQRNQGDLQGNAFQQDRFYHNVPCYSAEQCWRRRLYPYVSGGGGSAWHATLIAFGCWELNNSSGPIKKPAMELRRILSQFCEAMLVHEDLTSLIHHERESAA